MRSEDLSYFEDKEFLECLEQYEKAIENGIQPYMDADELTDIAEYYMIKNREQDANRCILLATTLHPDAIDPQVFLSRQQLFHGNIDKARSIADKIIDQEDREVKFLWAEILIKEGKSKKAYVNLQSYYQEITDERDLFLYDSAGVFMDYEEWTFAEKFALQLQEEYPDFDKTKLLICDIQVSCGKLTQAIPTLEEILEKDPFKKEAWELLAEAQCAKENYLEALDSIDYLLAIDEKNAQGQIIKANCLFHLERFQEAHVQYSKYLEQNPTDGSILFYDAMVLSSMERYEEANYRLIYALKYLDISQPEYTQSYMQMSYILSKQGKYEEALEALKASYDINQRNYDSEFYFLKGHIELENENHDKALLSFDKAEDLSEDKNGTKLMRSVELIENEFYEEGLSILKNLLRSSLTEPEANCYPYMAYASYFMPGQPDYRNYLHIAAKSNPKLTEYLFAPIYPNVPIDKYNEI